MANPTDEQWLDLFVAFEEYCFAHPWTWMSNADVIAIEHPSSREMGYSVAMGNAGYEFGLALYTGDAGLASYITHMTEEADPDSEDVLAQTSAVSAMLGTREDLDAPDRAVLRRIGIPYGKNDRCPFFRSVKPGLMPWYIDGDEAEFMTAALTNVLNVALRVREGKLDVHAGDEPGALLTRVFRDGEWRDEWRTMKPPPLELVPAYPDMDRLARIARQSTRMEMTWELGTFYLPTPIAEKKGVRPYLPLGILTVETQSMFILGMKMFPPTASTAERQDALVEAIEAIGFLPAALAVDSTRTARLVESVTAYLGIDLSVGVTSAFLDVRDELRAFTGNLG